MNNFFPDSHLLSCLNGRNSPLVVFGHGASCDIYSAKMAFLKNIQLPFEPSGYLVISDSSLLVFNNVKNENCLVNIEKGTFIRNRSPLGSSPKKPIGNSAIFQVEDGFVFFPRNTAIQDKTFIYSVSANRFKKVEMDLPNLCFSFGCYENGAFYRKNQNGNVETCSFKSIFKNKAFAPEMEIRGDVIADYLDLKDDFDLWRQVAYLSIEKGSLILVHPDKPDMTAYADYLQGKTEWRPDLVEIPNSGKVVLVKSDGTKKEIKINGFVNKYPDENVTGSAFLVGHDSCLDVYQTDDLALLSTVQRLGYVAIVLPDMRIAYQVENGIRILDLKERKK